MIDNLQKLESLFAEHECTDFRWIKPQDIVVAHWVRMKCTFGCPTYGHNATCPPHMPSVAECREFFNEYHQAVIFHFAKSVDKPEDRYVWTKKLNKRLLKVERAVFLSGYRKSLVFTVDQCTICKTCTGEPLTCKHPKSARPAPEGMAVDIFSTVKKVGFPIRVLTDYSDEMNRYALLMID